MKPAGWKKEPLSWKDYSHERIYGAAPSILEIKPLSVDTSDIPVVFQEGELDCVAAAVTWGTQFLEKEEMGVSVPLSRAFLAEVSTTAPNGATPGQVLNAAKNIGICESSKWLENNKNVSVALELNAKQHAIAGYAYVHNLNPSSLYHALKKSKGLLIGVDSYQGSEPHMMWAYNVEERDGVRGLKLKNWWRHDVQDDAWVPFGEVRFAASIERKKPEGKVAFPKLTVLKSKWDFISKAKKALAGITIAIASFFGALTGLPPEPTPVPEPKVIVEEQEPEIVEDTKPEEEKFGAAGVYDGWSSTIAGAGITPTDSSITVSSLTVGNTGVSIASASTSFPVYLTINPNSTSDREVVECHGLTAGSKTFTTCYRQIAPTCNNTTSTILALTGTTGAFTHPAGEPVIMSNNACFFNRFVDRTSLQMGIAGQKGFTSSSTYFGDNTTTTNAQINFLVGATPRNNVYLAFIGPVAGNSTATAVINLGAGEFEINASGTSIGVSPSGGLILNGGLLAINASSTGGFVTDTNNLVGVAVSSTASNNGGFLKYLSNKIYWDIVSFLARANTWIGDQIFNGNVTTTGILAVQTPTSTSDAANKGYVDNSISFFTATGTAGATIAAGDALYISTTGTLFLADADSTSTAQTFVGLAKTAAAVGAEVSYTRSGGLSGAVSGLSAGRDYYLSSTPGAILTAPPALPALPTKIGKALASGSFYVQEPTIKMRTGGYLEDITASQFLSLSVIPDRVDLTCGIVLDTIGASASQGRWVYDRHTNTSSTAARGVDDDAAPYTKASRFFACLWEEGASEWRANVIATSTHTTAGVVLTLDFSAARDILWTAEYTYP